MVGDFKGCTFSRVETRFHKFLGINPTLINCLLVLSVFSVLLNRVSTGIAVCVRVFDRS